MDTRRTTVQPDDASADGVRLADALAIVMRRKFVVAAIVIATFVLGLAHAFLTPRIYEYTTLVEVGTRYTGSRPDIAGRLELIEPIETVRAKVAGGYVADVFGEHFRRTGDTASYAVVAEVPKNSQVLLLKSKGTAESEAVYGLLHKAIVDRIRRDHSEVQEAFRSDLKVRLELLRRSLTELREQAMLFDAQLKRMEGKAELPARELSYLTSLRLADNQRAQVDVTVLIDNVRMQLASMRETRAAVSSMRSLQPVGMSKQMSVLIAAIVGLVLGIVFALFVDLMAKVREQAARANPAERGVL